MGAFTLGGESTVTGYYGDGLFGCCQEEHAMMGRSGQLIAHAIGSPGS
jgi:hypothetical protein